MILKKLAEIAVKILYARAENRGRYRVLARGAAGCCRNRHREGR